MRDCNNCAHSTRSGGCKRWKCEGTITVADIKKSEREKAIEEFGRFLSEEGFESSVHNINDWIAEYKRIKEQTK